MNHTVKCKYCSEVYEYTQYNDELGMVERHQSCPRCGHTANFLYGTGLDNTAWYEDALKYRSQKNEWISVEDRLPDLSTRVLIRDNTGHYYDATLNIVTSGKLEWFPTGIRHFTGKTTHWMPLPEPPKGE